MEESLQHSIVSEKTNMKIVKNIPIFCGIMVTFPQLFRGLKLAMKARQEGNIEKERELIGKAEYEWANHVLNKYNVTINIKGEEHIPMEEPVVFVANHQGYCDAPLFLAALKGKQIGFVAKDSVRKIPIFNRLVGYTRSVLINRGNPREGIKSITEGAEIIKKGFSLVIFPESTRAKGTIMKEFKPGSFKLATKAKAKIIPVTLNNTYKLAEETGILTPNIQLDFIIHEPVLTADVPKSEQPQMIKNIENTIRKTLATLIGDEQ